MQNFDQPMAEVFGFPLNNQSKEAVRYRKNKLCPFNNKVPSCTKDKAQDPLGVCSVYDHNNNTAITCPIRFRENWLIAEHSASFFFPVNQPWTSLTEIRLNDEFGKSAGNIDVVLVAYNEQGKIIDFGSLEVQAVYISGNIRNPFQKFMKNQDKATDLDWRKEEYYPRPDYLSSSRKRLVPQLLYKGSILKSWGKKMSVAVDKSFYSTLPKLKSIKKEDSDFLWLIYDLIFNKDKNIYELTLVEEVYTSFIGSLETIITPTPGSIDLFLQSLQMKLDEKLEISNAPDAPTLIEIIKKNNHD